MVYIAMNELREVQSEMRLHHAQVNACRDGWPTSPGQWRGEVFMSLVNSLLTSLKRHTTCDIAIQGHYDVIKATCHTQRLCCSLVLFVGMRRLCVCVMRRVYIVCVLRGCLLSVAVVFVKLGWGSL